MIPTGDKLAALVEGRVGPASRYVAVSIINVINHQVLLLIANSVWGWPGGWANAFAALVALVPAYVLTRTWVWSVESSISVRREVVPFFSLAILGLVVSSLTSEIADRLFGARAPGQPRQSARLRPRLGRQVLHPRTDLCRRRYAEAVAAAAPSRGRRPLTPNELAFAEAARGFMPPDEGYALWEAASAADLALGPLLEVGSYCGKSALYIGPVARSNDAHPVLRRSSPRFGGESAGLGTPRAGSGRPPMSV